MEDLKSKKKILIFIPAYNVEKKILSVINRIPKEIFTNNYIRILIIDDFSEDNTKGIVGDYIKRTNSEDLIYLIINKNNKGYGGVQKIAFKYAIENNFDYVIMLHGDGQYAPEKIPEYIFNLANTEVDAVFGSRFINQKDALKGGMPLYKFIGNKMLTSIQNIVIGSKMSEFHSGYRSFKVNSLKNVNFEINTNYFHFDTEIIIQMLRLKYVIKEIPMPTFYGNEVSHLRSIPYGLNVLLSTIKYKFFYRD